MSVSLGMTVSAPDGFNPRVWLRKLVQRIVEWGLPAPCQDVRGYDLLWYDLTICDTDRIISELNAAHYDYTPQWLAFDDYTVVAGS